MTLVDIAEIRAAADRIAGVAVRTPLLRATWAPDEQELWLKAENLQPIGAFKIRGAYNTIAALSPEVRARGIVAHSSGNHAQAVAYAARAFGVNATIEIPEGASELKVAATRALGAEVVRVKASERGRLAAEIAERDGSTMVPPFDDRIVIAGQGTIGLELVEDLQDIDRVLVPVSGGGLVAGVAAAVKAISPRTEVVAVEPELAADAQASFRARERVVWESADTTRTIADGLRVTAVGELPLEHLLALVDDVVTVTEDEIKDAMQVLALRSRLVVEPSGAVPVAAFRSGRLAPVRRTVAVVSGGNVDPVLLAEVLARPDPDAAR